MKRRNYNNLPENELVKDLKYNINSTINYFIGLIENEFANVSCNIYELKVDVGASYRIIGADLIFEIDDTKIIFLQIQESD